MKQRHVLILPILLLAVFQAACSKENGSTDVGGYPAGSRPSEHFQSVVVEVDPAKVKLGSDLYKQNCIFCHQADAIGKAGVAPSLTNKEFLSIASDAFLIGTIIEGRPGTGMPPFAHLGKDKAAAIVSFLRSHPALPPRATKVDAQLEAHGDPRLGKTWYDQICSTCHGPDGDGYAAGGTGTAIGKIGFLSKASDGFIRTTIKEGRSNTRMKAFVGPTGLAALTDTEVDDIIVYLRSIPKNLSGLEK